VARKPLTQSGHSVNLPATDQPVTETMQTTDKPMSDSTSKREQILQAALTVFSTRGYRETRVDGVAKEAGVAKGTIYLYFESKEDMYLEVFRENVEKLHQAHVDAVRDKASVWDKIRALVAVSLEFAEKHEKFLRIYLTEYGRFTGRPEFAKRLQESLEKGRALSRRLFEEGIEAGEVRQAPVEQLILMLNYSITGMMARRLTDIRRANEPELTPDQIVELLREGLRARH